MTKRYKAVVLVALIGSFSFTSTQADSDPSEKLMSALDKFEDTLNQAYDDLSEEQQTTVVEDRIENIDDGIDAAQKAIQSAQVSLKYMSYGSTAVKSEVYTELGEFYGQLYRSEKTVEDIADEFDDEKITNDQANEQLTAALNDVLGFISQNKADYAAIIGDILENQLTLALPSAQTSLDNLNASLVLYQATGASTSKLEKYIGLATTNLATATSYYNDGLVETNLEKQIQYYNNAAKYLVVAQAEIVSAQRSLDRLEK